MKVAFVSIAAAGLMFAGAAMAVDMPAVGKAKCSACHTIETKKIGPAWMDVSKKYKGDAEGISKITDHVTKGGSFGWKMGTMPPRGLGANDHDIHELAEFIVALDK